ncbi:MAG: putative sugar transporter, sugar-binding protein [Deltaproteobacteria bacterium]|nr:putative sugar transporter, sugar-binding protein [Deltaproteobacteria bacterium]
MSLRAPFANCVRWLVVLAALATACAPREDGATVQFWALGHEGDAVARLIPDFERSHPGVSVRVQQIPWSAAHEKLLTAFVGDSMPDVFQLGTTWIPEFQALGALEALDSYVARSATVAPGEYFAGVWDANAIDGALVALPWYVDTRLLFYRSDLLAAAGVATPPRTWAEWSAALERVKRSVGPDRHAIFVPLSEWEVPVVLALSQDAELLRDGDRYGNFESEAFRTAFAFYLDLFERGYAARAGAGATASVYRDFAEGWFCFYLSGPWNLGEFATRLPPALADAWTTAPLPGPDARRPGVSLAGGASLAIAAHSARKEAAWQLVEWLADPARQVEFYRASGDLPPRRSAWQDPRLANDARAQAFRAQLEHVRALPKVPEWERIAAKISRSAEAVVRGEMAPAAALAALDADVDAILAKRRSLLAGASRDAE